MLEKTKKGAALSLALAVLFTAFFTFQSQASALQPDKKININTASSAELQTLPRIGPAIAQRIIDYREENGKFNRITDLLKVKGIGEKTFEQIKDMITVGDTPERN